MIKPALASTTTKGKSKQLTCKLNLTVSFTGLAPSKRRDQEPALGQTDNQIMYKELVSIRKKHNTLKTPNNSKKPTVASTSQTHQLAVIEPSSTVKVVTPKPKPHGFEVAISGPDQITAKASTSKKTKLNINIKKEPASPKRPKSNTIQPKAGSSKGL